MMASFRLLLQPQLRVVQKTQKHTQTHTHHMHTHVHTHTCRRTCTYMHTGTHTHASSASADPRSTMSQAAGQLGSDLVLY